VAADNSTVDSDTVRRALEQTSVLDRLDVSMSALSIRAIGSGVNDVFRVESERGNGARFVLKFATFSTADHFLAAVAAYRLLGAYTDLPVPNVYTFEAEPMETPPFVVLEYCAGKPLAEGFRDGNRSTNPNAVRALGTVIREFAQIPHAATEGYGPITAVGGSETRPTASADYADCAEMLVDYATQFYTNPSDHEALKAVAQKVPEYLRRNRDRLPSSPKPSVVVTDLSPGNLLTPGGNPPSAMSDVAELSGVIDLERAKIAPHEFTAVNTEYLLTRYISDPQPVREALYEPLPFGLDIPARDLYRLVAMGRSVGALDFWYEPGSEEHRQRGEKLATEITRIIG